VRLDSVAAGARRQHAPAPQSGACARPLNFTVRRAREAPMKSALLSVLASAVAIVLGALMQLALTTLWPQVQSITIRHVSLDSYVVVGALLVLSFIVGRSPTRIAFWASSVVPLGWLAAMVATPHSQFGHVFVSAADIARLQGLTRRKACGTRDSYGLPRTPRCAI